MDVVESSCISYDKELTQMGVLMIYEVDILFSKTLLQTYYDYIHIKKNIGPIIHLLVK